jgi:hypothetical protein
MAGEVGPGIEEVRAPPSTEPEVNVPIADEVSGVPSTSSVRSSARNGESWTLEAYRSATGASKVGDTSNESPKRLVRRGLTRSLSVRTSRLSSSSRTLDETTRTLDETICSGLREYELCRRRVVRCSQTPAASYSWSAGVLLSCRADGHPGRLCRSSNLSKPSSLNEYSVQCAGERWRPSQGHA